jgi:hypothetical protein
MEILLRELSSDDDADIDAPSSLLADSSKPWQKEFNQYLDVRDEVPEGMTLIQWWGVGLTCSSCSVTYYVLVKCTTSTCLEFLVSRLSSNHGFICFK